MTILHTIVVVILSYLLGSLPTSLIVGRLFYDVDIRTKGSGNAGATNTFRVLGWKAGIVVVAVDVAKGAVATLFVSRIPLFGGDGGGALTPDALALASGCAAVIGHVWTVFARFRGGKGVAAAAGMISALYPPALAIAVGVFALAVISTGIVSVGSLLAAVCFPFIVLILDRTGVYGVSPLLFWFTIPLALLIIFTHRRNIERLIHGRENSFPKLMLLKRLFSHARRAE